ncbi:hypothetical protein SPRG_15090 [Saprolegnia parasitica CBS 223.65]|uniref:Leo1-like protein n=1 Tax=Saprolegnia parasitica (strain CBS 223.65) TaxID=695850 RepID=A0A067BZN3_SAPPC|nr:hypothetical protein SPRG_15090 [Saprolegnia parasitica CBS 223.65]KDO19756.1 hypothetical protein SPRG_15090 [Saprolegnia parasitica CBS 223.65]|eukprot:XP_012209519.1 hypothetical protein SPRG_15090 [Saprolegnia parasitica CBS 223.65]
MSEAKDANLFSDSGSSDGGSPKKAPAKAAAGSDNEDMADLFGSDYDSGEEEFKASGIKESPIRDEDRDVAPARAMPREVPDAHHDELHIPKAAKAPTNTDYFFTRPPNILRFVPDAYTQASIQKEKEETGDEGLYRNYVRWRYATDADGNVLVDPATGRPKRESNTRIVKWEDGTYTMFVGDEALTLTQQKVANSFIFANEQSTDETVLECHGRVSKKLTIRPIATTSSSHQSLKMSMRARHNKAVVRIQEYISEIDGTLDKEQRANARQEKMRLQNRKKHRDGYEYDRDRSSRMDAGFLEEGYDGVEYDDDNLSAIKQQYGGRGAAKKPEKPMSKRPAAPRPGGLDEYRMKQRNRQASDESEPDDDDDDDEEEEMMRSSSAKKRRTLVDEDESD